jgi:uncharacterized protein (TIGR03086 family)
MDGIALYEQASEWTKSKIEGARGDLSAQTACDEWTVRDLVNHLLFGEQIFVGMAKGEQGSGPPQGPPPELLKDRDPVEAFEGARQAILEAFRKAEGDIMFPVGIAFADTLTHGWDLAKGTGQDTTMPEGLADAAMGILGGRLTPESRGTNFKPEVEVGEGASTQDRFVAYLGRTP